MKPTIAVVVIAGTLLGGARAEAHFSFPATYTVNNMVRLEGTVSQLLLRDPHTCLQIAPDVRRQMQRWSWGTAGGQSVQLPPRAVAPTGPWSDCVFQDPAPAVVFADEDGCDVLEPSQTFVPRAAVPSADFTLLAFNVRSGRPQLVLTGGSHSGERR